MLDLETWGTAPGCAIRSVGAVVFDPMGSGTGEEFYANVDDDSCVALKLTREESTVKWWAKQSQQAQDSLLRDRRSVYEVSRDLEMWFRRVRGMFVWSQGANFDEVIMQAVFRATGVQSPWKFYNARDTRTAYEMARFDPRTLKRDGVYHNALDDAKHQARCVQMSYAKLYNGRAA
jgi:hypothetical protein